MSGGPGMEAAGAGRGPDGYAYDLDDVQWLESFTVAPVPPVQVADRLDAGERLATLDVPTHLEEPLTVQVDTGTVLYRLVQLFGTPNVPGLRAGEPQPDRELRTWQYLFEVTHEPTDEPAREWLVSVYDYRTDLSVGVSSWEPADEAEAEDADPGTIEERDADGAAPVADRVPEPGGAVPASLSVPEERFLVAFVQLVLRTVEEPVRATYKELWV